MDRSDGDVSERPLRRDLTRPSANVSRWFIFHGDRLHVTAVLLAAVFAGLVVLAVAWPIEYRRLVAETGLIQTVFNTILGGVILLVSIVVAVVAVGVSQELTTLGEQTDRVDDAITFRQEADLPDDAEMPAQTGVFLAMMVTTIRERLAPLRDIEDGTYDDAFHDGIDELARDIEANVDELQNTLESVRFGTTDELIIGLDYDASWQLHHAAMLVRRHEDELAPEDVRTLEALTGALREFLIGREYFKSLYYKREFSDLAKSLLVVSLPVIIFIIYVILAIDTGAFPDVRIMGLSPLALFLNAAFTIALAPYVLLTSYVFRAASITKRTLAAGPFVHDAAPGPRDRSHPQGR